FRNPKMAEFVTKDLPLAAFLEVSCGVIAELRADSDGQSLLVFTNSEGLQGAVEKFFADGVVPARKFSRRVGILRSRCRELRQRGPIARENGLLKPNSGD